MRSKLLILLILTIVIVFTACGNQKDKIYIENDSAFAIEQNALKIHLTLANGTEQTSEPFKVKLKINNPILSAALSFYEKEIIESQLSKSPFVIESYKEINMDQSFPLNLEFDESLIGDNVDKSDNVPSVEVEIISDSFDYVLPLDKF